ncbi:uncharacterized protein LOC128679490 [Plodia interpunctella]|uniref:uncharacterized protein LOC128672653 n=1 Tax=Plodia interpunctella TaxID=58824 RepID=UPI002367BDDF|nr:uncharacterized protein LOC128672653 [Plodia interpunctella]XP_053617746.1 uncharacterized protein LOC128679490 [Plodia interpunctella]
MSEGGVRDLTLNKKGITMMASRKKLIPQEGTSLAGESLSSPSGVDSPTVSGGGTNRQRDVSPSQLSTQSMSQAGSVYMSDSDSDSGHSLPEVTLTEEDKDGRGSAPLKRKALEVPESKGRAKMNTATRGRPGFRRTYGGAEGRKGGSMVDEHLKVVREAANRVLEDASKSGNLKGSIWRSMKESCQQIMEATDKIQAQQVESEAVRILTADNKRMREQLELLQKETKALRTAYAEKSAEPPTTGTGCTRAEIQEVLADFKESLERDLFVRLGGMVTDRLKEAEKRGILTPEPTLRPPLAADKRHHEAERPNRKEASSDRPTTLMPPARPGPAVRNATRPALQSRDKEPKQGPSNALDEIRPVNQNEERWATVVKRRKGKGKGKKSSPDQAKPTQAQARSPGMATKPPPRKMFTPPKSAAVVVTLRPESRMDYKSLMARVTTLKLASIGVDHVAVRRTATGARIIEVPGADSAVTADTLAEKLRELIGAEAEVSRPYKTAQVKISGFDEAVTQESLREAAAGIGNCPPEQIKVGAIRMAPDQTGAAILTCPVAAANSLIKAGHLLVGWSAAKVKGLEALPMRCFRCMGMGHTRALCPSPVDRSNVCHRCGKTSHVTAECSAKEPWCAVCHAAKLPAGHVMGGKACNPPRTRGKTALATREVSEGRLMEH